MIILLHGENSFLSKRKLDEIVAQYKAKHKSGLSFFVFDETFDFDEFKNAYETVSMFEEKKLIVCKNILGAMKKSEAFFAFLKSKDAKENKDIVTVFYESDILEAGKNEQLVWLATAPTMVQESKSVQGARLVSWIESEAARHKASIARDAAELLVRRSVGDMWLLTNEVAKLAQYDKRITRESVFLLTSSREEADTVFGAIDALAEKKFAPAMKGFYALINQGEDRQKMFGALVFQFRNMLKVKSLMDRKIPQEKMKELSGVKPFVFSRMARFVNHFTVHELASIFELLCDADVALKTGSTSFEEVLERLMLTMKTKAVMSLRS